MGISPIKTPDRAGGGRGSSVRLRAGSSTSLRASNYDIQSRMGDRKWGREPFLWADSGRVVSGGVGLLHLDAEMEALMGINPIKAQK